MFYAETQAIKTTEKCSVGTQAFPITQNSSVETQTIQITDSCSVGIQAVQITQHRSVGTQTNSKPNYKLMAIVTPLNQESNNESNDEYYDESNDEYFPFSL